MEIKKRYAIWVSYNCVASTANLEKIY